MILFSEGENLDRNPMVVGLGASAVGLEALRDFFEAVPDSPGMAFVVVIHRSPDHKGSIASLLQEHTPLPVRQVRERTRVKADHIYIIPPGRRLSLKDQHLVFADPEENMKKHTTVDLFFRFLGKAKGNHSACIILSGTGSDGSIGLKTVKEHGGIVIIQDPKEAGHDGMPRSALQTGLVDLALPVKEIPAKLRDYRENLSQISIPDSGELPDRDVHVLRNILSKMNFKESLHATSSHTKKMMTGRQQLSIEDLHHRLLFKQYEPASVIINNNQEVLHTTSDIDRFLKYSGGEPSQRILEMVVPEFRKVLSRLLFQVKQGKNALSSKKVRLNRNGASGFYKIMIRKIAEPKAPEGLMHIIFMEVSDVAGGYLQTSNEELQSMNEELISTTEQLEISKEKLQSVNEELKCVNAELKHKIEKLNQTNSHFKNLMKATEVATIFVDGDDRVQFFTAAATNLFHLIPSDVGRPFMHITHQLNYDATLADIDQVNDSLESIQKVVSDDEGHAYSMRICPYRTVNDNIDGVVLTFMDITQLKKVEKQLKDEVELSTRLQKEILSNSLKERWKLGAYLHDNLAQILVSIKILVNEVKNELTSTDPADTSSILANINNLIDVQIDNIENISHDIIPIDVEEGGVLHAFNLLMRRSQEIHEVKCTLETNRILNQISNRELSTNLYHITQEAIKNAAVHGEVGRISVIIDVQEGQLRLEINADGMGFSSAEKSSDGMGLRIMRHRMELLGGTFTVKSLPDSENFTTSIRCTIPVKAITSSSKELEPMMNG